MLIPSGRFSLPFTCVDSTGAPVAPTGTPTAVLVKNGTDLGTTVTVTMSTANGNAACTLPSDAVADDRFHIRLSAVISGVTYTLAGPAASVQNPVTLPTIPTDWITSNGIATDAIGSAELAAGAVTKIQTGLATPTNITAASGITLAAVTHTGAVIPTVTNVGSVASFGTLIADIVTAVWAAGTRTLTAFGFTVAPTAAAVAAAILETPTNKLVTDADGYVTSTNGGGGGGGGEVTGLSAAAIAQLAGTTIRLASTEQTDSRTLEIVQGCDYAAADGTAITWTLTDAEDLEDATASLRLKKGTTTQNFAGTVTETAANTWSIAIEITAAQSAALAASPTDWTYSLTITLANSHVRTIRKPGHFARVLSPT